MASKRTGDRLELTKDEHVLAAMLAFSADLGAGRRSPVRKVSEVVDELNAARAKAHLPEVGPDTVNRAIRRAIELRWVVASPSEVVSSELVRQPDLEAEVAERFQLDHAIVALRSDEEVRGRDDWYGLQVQLGFLMAEHIAEGGNREFRRSSMRSFGLGGGHAVRAFAHHMKNLKPIGHWPRQRVYSLAGTWSDRPFEMTGDYLLLDADSAAADFASCFAEDRDLFRVKQPLILEHPEDLELRRGMTALGKFGSDGLHTTAILGVSFGLLQGGVTGYEDVISQANANPTALIQETGDLQLDLQESSSFAPHIISQMDHSPLNPAVYEDPDSAERYLLCASLDDLKRADEICLIGGGPSAEYVLDTLMTKTFRKVSQIATTSETAKKLLEWEKE